MAPIIPDGEADGRSRSAGKLLAADAATTPTIVGIDASPVPQRAGERCSPVDDVRCPECGAPAVPRSCGELFEVLLALDHSRKPPWGPLHAVSVSCYLLQHPAGSSVGVAERRAVLQAYLDGGLRAVEELTARARRGNAHRTRAVPRAVGTVNEAVPVGPYAVTIADVADGADFPAAGFEARVRDWAAAIQS